MKKLLMSILTLVLALVLALPAFAEEAETDAWYSLEDEVLTVTLPLSVIDELSNNAQVDPAPSYDVEAIDSPQGIFELITSEIQDDCWVGSYRVVADYDGAVTLTFTTTCDGNIWSRYALDILISESSIEVVDENKPWFGIYDGNLRLSLPANSTTGYTWKYEISDPDMLEPVKDEYVQDAAQQTMVGAGGIWTAEFDGAGAGEVKLTLRYCRDWEDQQPAQEYSLQLNVAENGDVTIASVETIVMEVDDMFIDSVTTETPSEPEPVE